MPLKTMKELSDFIKESNDIESELTDNLEGEMAVYKRFLKTQLCEQSVLDFHKEICDVRGQLMPDDRGAYRTVNVVVGDATPTAWTRVPAVMNNFWFDLDTSDPFGQHLKFERIHPFRDLNGRTGRAIWLHMQGGKAPLGFLHEWYYQTFVN